MEEWVSCGGVSRKMKKKKNSEIIIIHLQLVVVIFFIQNQSRFIILHTYIYIRILCLSNCRYSRTKRTVELCQK